MQEVRWHLMIENSWILCPICRNKTRIKIRGDTVLENFPLYCPKCKQENLIRAYQLNIIVIKEPDAQTPVSYTHLTYGIYPSEIAALQKDYADLWEPLSELLKKLSKVVGM